MNRELAAFAAAALTVFAGVAPFLTVGLAAAGNADPPTVTTASPTDVSDTEVTFNGELQDTGNATNVTVRFEYWTEGDPANASLTPDQVLSAPGSFNASVADLTANTTYFVVAHANASDGDSAAGEPVTVTTTADPSVTTGSPTGVTASSATLTGTLSDLGGAANATVWFTYWPDGNPANQSTTGGTTLDSPGTVTTAVSGLQANETYVFEANVEAADGDTAGGEPVAFTTHPQLQVRTDAPTDVTADSATFNGDLGSLGGADNATVGFAYWVAGDRANTTHTGRQTLNETGTFTTAVDGLHANTSYVVVAEAAASDGDTVNGTPVRFTTQRQLRVTTGNATNVSARSATLHGTLDSLGGAANASVGFAYWVAGDPVNVSRTAQIALSDPVAFSTGVAGLEPNTTYVTVAEATAADGDEATGEQVTFTTVSADDLSIGVSQGSARVTIAVTRDGESVENATVRVLGGSEAVDRGPYQTDADGTVVIPAPDSTVTVTIEAKTDGLVGLRTVTLHAQRGHGAPFTPFGQRVSAYVDSLLTGDAPEPLGRLVADFVTAANPGHGPPDDRPDEDVNNRQDTNEDENPGTGPPDHARNGGNDSSDKDDAESAADEADEDDDATRDRGSDESSDRDADEMDDEDDGGDDDEDRDNDARGPPDHARNDENPGRGH